MNRREFIRVVAAAGVGVAAVEMGRQFSVSADRPADTQPAGSSVNTSSPPAVVRSGDMIIRTLGRTGEKVSLIGLGGYHISGQKDEADSIKIIRSAIDRGITFLDNCWDYRQGASEERMGKALADGYRQKVFLMSKIDGRNKATAAKQIDESLKRLATDHVDLMQFHEILRMEDPDRIFAEGGGMEAMVAAKKAGKVRYIGFTGHKDPLVHLRMLEVAAENEFRFDAVQMPLNVLDAHFRSFAEKVVPGVVKEQIGVLGMKPLASGALLKTGTVTATEALHYAMNLPTSVVITGIDTMEVLDQALEAVKTFKPMTQTEVKSILDKTVKAAKKGLYERFKTTTDFDGTANNPDWMS